MNQLIDPKVFPDDWVFDMSPFVKFDQNRVREQYEYEWEKYADKIVKDKRKSTGRTYSQDLHGDIVTKKRPMMRDWGRMHVLYRSDVDEGKTIVEEIFEQLPEFPEDDCVNQRLVRWQHLVDNTVPFHKDPQSSCWIGIKVIGDQDLEFAKDNPKEGSKQADGIFVGKINMSIALVNSKALHAPVSDGNMRTILRRVFTTDTSYLEIKALLKEHFKCGSG